MIASELRIGNLVCATIAADGVTAFGNGKTVLQEKVIASGIDIDNANLYVPIPLTEEWLVKLGFKQDFVYKYRYSIKTFVVNRMCCDENGEYWCLALDYGQALKTKLQSVHQLQNLFFAITAQELCEDKPLINKRVKL